MDAPPILVLIRSNLCQAGARADPPIPILIPAETQPGRRKIIPNGDGRNRISSQLETRRLDRFLWFSIEIQSAGTGTSAGDRWQYRP